MHKLLFTEFQDIALTLCRMSTALQFKAHQVSPEEQTSEVYMGSIGCNSAMG